MLVWALPVIVWARNRGTRAPEVPSGGLGRGGEVGGRSCGAGGRGRGRADLRGPEEKGRFCEHADSGQRVGEGLGGRATHARVAPRCPEAPGGGAGLPGAMPPFLAAPHTCQHCVTAVTAVTAPPPSLCFCHSLCPLPCQGPLCLLCISVISLWAARGPSAARRAGPALAPLSPAPASPCLLCCPCLALLCCPALSGLSGSQSLLISLCLCPFAPVLCRSARCPPASLALSLSLPQYLSVFMSLSLSRAPQDEGVPPSSGTVTLPPPPEPPTAHPCTPRPLPAPAHSPCLPWGKMKLSLDQLWAWATAHSRSSETA